MASPEQQRGEPQKEQPGPAYYRAARYPREEPAWQTYTQVQNLIFGDRRADLSVYRIQLDFISHVVVLGTPPPQRLAEKLEHILAAGELMELSSDVLSILQQRRWEARKLGAQVERHWRPGERIPLI